MDRRLGPLPGWYLQGSAPGQVCAAPPDGDGQPIGISKVPGAFQITGAVPSLGKVTLPVANSLKLNGYNVMAVQQGAFIAAYQSTNAAPWRISSMIIQKC